MLAGIAGVLVGGVVLLMRGWFRDESPPATASEPVLAVPARELDLGRVYETKAYEHTLHITNRTTRPLTILRFEKSCDCLGISPESQVTLQPSDTRRFTVKLSLVAGAARPPTGEGEPFEVRLAAVHSVDGGVEATTAWSLKAVVVPTIRIRPGAISFGSQSERQSVLERVLEIEAADGIERLDCESPPFWEVAIAREEGNSASRRFRATLRSKGQLTVRTIADAIQLTPVNRDGERLPSKEIRIAGEIVHDVVAIPREIHHGRQPCGMTVVEAIRLRSLTDRPFRVQQVTASTDALEVTRIGGEKEGWVYALGLRFSDVGDQRARATFLVREGDGREYHLEVGVRYQGLPPVKTARGGD